MANMLRISEAASLGMHAAAVLASRPKQRTTAAQLAQKLDASEAHLAKVMQRLGKAGLVTSTRGPNGGFALAKSADKVRLLDVYEAVDGELDPDNCLLGLPVCPGRKCILGDLAAKVNKMVQERLAGTTLAALGTAFKE